MSERAQDDVANPPNVQGQNVQNTPPTPPSPDDVDVDLRASRKREREVSLEPATPKADDSASEDTKETRPSAPKKKNRVQLGTTEEEDETPPESPDKNSVELATSPPYETKVRQISRKVRGMKWDDRERTTSASTIKEDSNNDSNSNNVDSNANAESTIEVDQDIELNSGEAQDVELEAPAEIVSSQQHDSNSTEKSADSESKNIDQEESSKGSPADTSMELHNEASNDEPQSSVVIVAPPETAHSSGSDTDDQEKSSDQKSSSLATMKSVASVEQPASSKSAEDATKRSLPLPGAAPELSSKSSEPTKRARDDNEEDDANPREKKRPTPPPEEQAKEEKKKGEEAAASTSAGSEPVAPQPKIGGFLAYAATSSPFATAKGPSIFGQKSTPSPSPLAGTSNGSATSLSSTFEMKSTSPFAISSANKTKPSSSSSSFFSSSSVFSGQSTTSNHNSNPATSPTGIKRSGFEAFASASSPFANAASRSKSPPSSFGLARSKSPTRRGPAGGAGGSGASGSGNAFKSYAGAGTQGFSVVAPSPPVKKLRQDAGDDAGEEGSKTGGSGASGAGTTGSVLGEKSNSASEEGSDEDSEKLGSGSVTTFSERLRAGQNVDDSFDIGEEEKMTILEQEVQTGEENEDTIFQVRGKLYALSDQNQWKERGTGLLKLNVRKSDAGGARLVMRKEAVYTLLLNVQLFKGMRCSIAQDPRYVRFSVIEFGSTVHYNLRLSNSKVAGDLIEEINANIPSEERENAV